MRQLAAVFCCLFMLPGLAKAHNPNQGYIFLKVYDDAIEGRIEVTSDELNKVFDWQLESHMMLEELEPYLPEILRYAADRVSFSSPRGEHPMQFTEPGMLISSEHANFLRLNFILDQLTPVPEYLDVRYDMFFEADPNHSGLLLVEHNWKQGIVRNRTQISLEFGPNQRTQQLSLTETSVMRGFSAMIRQGAAHYWIGLDHILFLLAFLLPSVLKRGTSDRRIPVDRFRSAFIYLIKIVTAFTVAHSITLALAALEIIVLPGRLAGSLIALSIGLAAFHNIRPLFKYQDWVLAFALGLFHGFGLASILGEIGLRDEYLGWSLVGFNVGIELGQLVMICLIFPILYLLRNRKIYPKILLYGSRLLILIALYWLTERIFDIDMMLDNHFIKAYSQALRMIGLI